MYIIKKVIFKEETITYYTFSDQFLFQLKPREMLVSQQCLLNSQEKVFKMLSFENFCPVRKSDSYQWQIQTLS